MSHDKSVQGNHFFIPVMLGEQILPTTFAFALQHIVDIELDLSPLTSSSKTMPVLLICDAQDVIDSGMFIIDGVELPGKASKQKNGTRADAWLFF